MIYVYITILIFASWLVSFFTNRLTKRTMDCIMWIFAILMIIISATRPDTGVSDLKNYEDMFYNYDRLKYQISVEPTYLWLSKVINDLGGGFRIILWVYAVLAIPMKLFAFKRLSSYEMFFCALPVYLSFFFLMHDCEQIRVAVAAAFAMIAYACRVEGRKWYIWLLPLTCGIFFHYSSAIAIVPLLLYSQKSLNHLWKIALICCALGGIVILIMNINIFHFIPISGFEAKMALYEYSIQKGEHLEKIPLLYPVSLLRYATFFYALYFYDTIRPHVKGINIILISNALGLFAWGALSGIPVFAVRISEFFQVTEALLFASIMYTIRPMWAGKLYSLLSAMAVLLYGMLFINQFGYL